MLIAAVVIGFITAYYFGVTPGVYAATAAVGLFAVAHLIPSLAVPVYLAVGIGLVGVLFFGPRVQRQGHKTDFLRWARRALKRLWRLR